MTCLLSVEVMVGITRYLVRFLGREGEDPVGMVSCLYPWHNESRGSGEKSLGSNSSVMLSLSPLLFVSKNQVGKRREEWNQMECYLNMHRGK